MAIERIIGVLAMLAEASGEAVSKERLKFTAERLMTLDAGDVMQALARMLESSRRFPTVAEVKAEMGIADATPRDEANQLADRIITAMSKFGEIPPGNVTTARALEHALGESAWTCVERLGGWTMLLDRASDNVGMLRAHIRDAAESFLRTGVIERNKVCRNSLNMHEAINEVKRLGLAAPHEPEKLAPLAKVVALADRFAITHRRDDLC